MTEKEFFAFSDACESGMLCEAAYCPYLSGHTSRLVACDGDFCLEAWQEFCDAHKLEYER